MVLTPETAVALMTGALAAATFWLAWEARKARREARRDDERRILRAALAEQLDNCRAWAASDPARGEPAFRNLQGATPRLVSVAAVIDHLDLPPDVVAYLIWLTSTIGDHWGRIEQQVDLLARLHGGSVDQERASRLTDDWRAMLERLQVLAALTAAEARRRGLDDVARPHDVVPWTVVPMRPERSRELTAIDEQGRGAPRFPSDPAFANVRPEARDLAGAATGARQEAALHDAVNPQVRRLLGRR